MKDRWNPEVTGKVSQNPVTLKAFLWMISMTCKCSPPSRAQAIVNNGRRNGNSHIYILWRFIDPSAMTDATVAGRASSSTHSTHARASASSDLHDQYIKLLTPTHRHRTSSEIAENLKRLRRLVLTDGIPDGVGFQR
jgi:hypothetical protein